MKKIIVFLCVCLTILVILNSVFYHEQKIAILGYHSFYKDISELKNEDKNNPEFINDISKFEKQMKYLHKHHYKTLTLDEFYDWKKGKRKIPRKSVLITIDDGNLSNYMYAFPILKKYNMNAIVFFIGGASESIGLESGTIYDYMSLSLIEKCKSEYPMIEFQSHSYNMHGMDVTHFSVEDIKKDINFMKSINDFKYYAYPFGVYDDRMINELKNDGYIMAFKFGPGKEYRKARKSDDDYKIARLNISNRVSFAKFLIRLYAPF
jgi:peptidoglycan/xylan/chitin deacetylase (PgdA/CDA1 family)